MVTSHARDMSFIFHCSPIPLMPAGQGLFGPDKLPAVILPGMKDDIYFLRQILKPNHKTGTANRIAENGVIVCTI